jgi:hypothetical protein
MLLPALSCTLLMWSQHGPMKLPLKEAASPEVVRVANALLDIPMGQHRVMEVDGKPYVFVAEPHYHPPGFTHGPNGWHKGVTVYEYVF